MSQDWRIPNLGVNDPLQTENMLMALRNEHQRLVEDSEEQLVKLRESHKSAEDERKRLSNLLDEEKR